MNKMEKFDLCREAKRLGDDFNYDTFLALQKIGKLARKHKYLCECSCNGEYKGRQWEEIDNMKIDTVEAQIRRIIFKLNINMISFKDEKCFTLEFQHDPRGLTVKVRYGNSNERTDLYYLIGGN